jgi:hypothetical protein
MDSPTIICRNRLRFDGFRESKGASYEAFGFRPDEARFETLNLGTQRKIALTYSEKTFKDHAKTFLTLDLYEILNN